MNGRIILSILCSLIVVDQVYSTLVISFPDWNDTVLTDDVIVQNIHFTFDKIFDFNTSTFRPQLECKQKFVCHLERHESNVISTTDKDNVTAVVQFNLYGDFVGITHVQAVNNDDWTDEEVVVDDKAEVRVLRTVSDAGLQMYVQIFGLIFTSVNTFVMGTQLKLDRLIAIAKKPIGPLIGLVCQFVIMPSLAYGLATVALSGQPSLQLGLFAVGTAPGGGMSNQFAILLDGNLDMSIAMTVASTIGALVAMPAWLLTLGPTFYSDTVDIPFMPVVRSLGIMLAPIILGMIAARFAPSIVRPLHRALQVITIVLAIIGVPFVVYTQLYIFTYMSFLTVGVAFALSSGGATISYVVAVILRQSRIDCRTICIETSVQNTIISMLVVMNSMPSPESDLAAVIPVSSFVTTPPIFILWIVVRMIRKRFFGLETPEECKVQRERDTKEAESSVVKQIIGQFFKKKQVENKLDMKQKTAET